MGAMWSYVSTHWDSAIDPYSASIVGRAERLMKRRNVNKHSERD